VSKWTAAGTAVVIVVFGLVSVSHLRAQQVSSALSLPFSTTGTGPAGVVQASGVFRIAQFTEQNGRLFAAGTLTVGVGDQASAASTTSASPASNRAVVTQVVLPVLAVSSGSTSAALTFGASSTSTTSTFSTVGAAAPGVSTASAPIISGTTVSQAGGTSAPTTTAGVPASAAPGQVANCGPLHLEVGPVDLDQPTLALHLDRLVLDVTPPSASPTSLNQWMCSVDAALAQAASAGATTAGGTQAVGMMGTITTAGTVAGTAGTTPGTQPATPLQNFVTVLNQGLGVL
jgi:hypothetical protein